MQRADVFGTDVEYSDADPAGYRCGLIRVGQGAAGTSLAVRAYELPAGESVCPYHYEYVEEWLLILEGSVSVRTPDGEGRLERGELVCFPPGPQGAHKVTNNGEATVRVLMFSSAGLPAVAVYPDSDKVGVWPGNPDDNVMLRRGDGQVDYWDGER
jgi:uncharacterized cupin superfamily protein